ncbi:endonuclease VIII [Alteromonas gilva]|uniref:DNA-(apurinic or apyrimidinic site) lyase n=1 Tax=Alteromonas gilva TaxID=2987522 RepID=A0ABT5L5W7_9ALTE|nr:endonuclease VIII [Alteromonas gilva]MDC8832426.1 endonuclease VIII [Alteromonas gilva]
MPEGPEIRQSADALAQALVNQRLERVTLGLDALKPFHSQLTGQLVKAVTCRGKAMLIHLANGLSVYSHNQLYGLWVIAKRGEIPDTRRSLRLALHTKERSALLYSASDISVWQTEQLSQHPFLRKLGPDVLSEQLDASVIAERLLNKRFSGRRLSALYLDQHFVAGLGNYLRSEVLFFAGLHPDKKPRELTHAAIHQLAEQTIIVSKRSYHTGGYTVPVKAKQVPAPSRTDYEASRFMVFGRDQKPCRVCGELIVRAERNSRRVYFCPACQQV